MIQMQIAYGRMGPPAETASSNLPAPPDDTFILGGIPGRHSPVQGSIVDTPLLFLSQDSHQHYFSTNFVRM